MVASFTCAINTARDNDNASATDHLPTAALVQRDRLLAPMEFFERAALAADWLRLLIEPGSVTELRCIGARSWPGATPFRLNGFYDYAHLDRMALDALDAGMRCEGVYWMLNPVELNMLDKRRNHCGISRTGQCA